MGRDTSYCSPSLHARPASRSRDVHTFIPEVETSFFINNRKTIEEAAQILLTLEEKDIALCFLHEKFLEPLKEIPRIRAQQEYPRWKVPTY